MDNRIEELSLLCWEEVGDYTYGSFKAFNHKLFAELIGKEVLTLQNRHGNIKPRVIKEFFGVDE